MKNDMIGLNLISLHGQQSMFLYPGLPMQHSPISIVVCQNNSVFYWIFWQKCRTNALRSFVLAKNLKYSSKISGLISPLLISQETQLPPLWFWLHIGFIFWPWHRAEQTLPAVELQKTSALILLRSANNRRSKVKLPFFMALIFRKSSKKLSHCKINHAI